ncbi:MAG: hypothetical protein JJE25_06545 [Bacteroidia bacterium]|nr:hypothetical protein [Bacteroidia bacterium]
MARRNLRVNIPRIPVEMITLARNIVAKHVADGPLSPLPESEVQVLRDLIALAAPLVDRTEQLHRDAETATESRNKLLGTDKNQNEETTGTVLYSIRMMKNILAGRYLGQEHVLGDWGFEIDTSPRPKKPPASPPA